MSVHLRRQSNSPFWYAEFPVWDSAKGKSVRKLVSTKTSNKKDARRIADEKARAAGIITSAAKSGGMSRQAVVELVNGLLTMAGIRHSVSLESWTDFSERWLKTRSIRISSSSLTVYRGHLKEFARFMGPLVDGPMMDITVAHLQDWYEDLAKRFTPETCRSRIKFIQAMFRRARAERIIESSPFDLLEKRKMQSKPKEPFEVDEVGKLIAVCRQREWLDKETVIWLGLCTGARFTDCAQMSTKHLDRDKWVLKWQERKTKKAMVVPVVEPLKSHLQRLLADGVEGALCPSLATMRASGLSNMFRYLCETAGVGTGVRQTSTKRQMKDRSFHNLRHTLTSWMAEAGVEASTRRAIIGHTTAAVHERYTHVHAVDTLRTAVEQGLARLAPQSS